MAEWDWDEFVSTASERGKFGEKGTVHEIKHTTSSHMKDGVMTMYGLECITLTEGKSPQNKQELKTACRE